MKCSEKMNLLKKDERVLLLNFEEGPGVPLLNLKMVLGPTFKLSGQSPILGPRVPRSWVPGTLSHFYEMAALQYSRWDIMEKSIHFTSFSK